MAVFSFEEGTTTLVFPTDCALRMRVSMSAIGSVMLIRSTLLAVPGYQLAFTTPGISPRMATSRSLLRARPNLRNTPRGRPVSRQRLRRRVGEALRGSCCRASRAAMRSSSETRWSSMVEISAARFFANFATVLRRFASRLMMDVFAMCRRVLFCVLCSVGLERKLERRQQRTRLVVRLGRSGNADVHSAQRVDLVVLDLGEDDLLAHAQVVVAAAVEGAVGDAAEVADARHGDGDQAVEEVVHAPAAQRHH